MNQLFVCLAILFGSLQVVAATSTDPLEVAPLRKRIQSLRNEISEMRQSIEEIEKEHRSLVVELSEFEKSFQNRFSRVLIPLLNWPSLPPLTHRSSSQSSWVSQAHMKLVLMTARERLVKEPLELISERELRITRVHDKKVQVSEGLKYLEAKEGLLNLQLEELQFMQKKLRKSKKG